MSITWLSEPWGARLGDELTGIIRQTRLIELKGFPGVWLKCEHENPSGSHKDRAYVAMLREQEGLSWVTVLVDYSTGNGGVTLAWLAQRLGKRAVVFMPDGLTKERSDLIRSYGAELVITPKDEFVRGARKAAEAFVAANPRSVLMNQSDNLWNQRAYIEVGDEIVRQFRKKRVTPKAFVCGIGTGGAFSGISLALKSQFSAIRCIAIEVSEAPMIWAKRNGKSVTATFPSITGFGAGAIALNTDERLIDEVVVVSADAVKGILSRLLETDGLSVGPSTAANILIAGKRAAEYGAPVVTISFDRGDRYSA